MDVKLLHHYYSTTHDNRIQDDNVIFYYQNNIKKAIFIIITRLRKSNLDSSCCTTNLLASITIRMIIWFVLNLMISVVSGPVDNYIYRKKKKLSFLTAHFTVNDHQILLHPRVHCTDGGNVKVIADPELNLYSIESCIEVLLLIWEETSNLRQLSRTLTPPGWTQPSFVLPREWWWLCITWFISKTFKRQFILTGNNNE